MHRLLLGPSYVYGHSSEPLPLAESLLKACTTAVSSVGLGPLGSSDVKLRVMTCSTDSSNDVCPGPLLE